MAEQPQQDDTVSDLVLTDAAVRLPDDLDPAGTYDVEFGGHAVWSFQPVRDGRRRGEHWLVPWPKTLARVLRGRSLVELRDHADGRLVAASEHVFGDAPEKTLEITDRAGRPLVVDKYGKLIRPLSAEGGDTLVEMMDHVERLLEVMNEAGTPAFIAYGTLLGAVRNGHLIGHDNDVDLAYVSAYEHPADIVREGYRVERVLSDAGWLVRRGSGSRLNVRLALSDGTMRFVDVFTSHWTEGVYYMPQDTGFELPRETILPLSTVELEGRQLPAPADPETLLAATYGPGWRTPDPSFKYETPRWLSRRIGGWYGGLRTGRKQWDVFYGARRGTLPGNPTPFAKWVTKQFPGKGALVDLGTGNGRDAMWFARRGRQVTAVDYCLGPLNRAAARARDRGLEISFEALNLYDTRQVLALGTRLAGREQPTDLYGRFLLHALEAPGRENLFRLASMALRTGGRLLLEFRTTEDAGRPHHFTGTGKRHFLDPDDVVAEIEAHGGQVLHTSSGTGLAAYQEEDPHVCRLVATWAR